MNEQAYTLAVRHGALRARIAAQREAIAAASQPVAQVCGWLDRGQQGLDWARAHPLPIGGAAFLLALIRPRRAWRWARRAVVLWRGWQGVKSRFFGVADGA